MYTESFVPHLQAKIYLPMRCVYLCKFLMDANKATPWSDVAPPIFPAINLHKQQQQQQQQQAEASEEEEAEAGTGAGTG